MGRFCSWTNRRQHLRFDEPDTAYALSRQFVTAITENP